MLQSLSLSLSLSSFILLILFRMPQRKRESEEAGNCISASVCNVRCIVIVRTCNEAERDGWIDLEPGEKDEVGRMLNIRNQKEMDGEGDNIA